MINSVVVVVVTEDTTTTTRQTASRAYTLQLVLNEARVHDYCLPHKYAISIEYD